MVTKPGLTREEKYNSSKEPYAVAKAFAKLALITYILGGSVLYSNMLGYTGHRSADLHEGRCQMTGLEKKFYNYAFDKLGIDKSLLEQK
jgi:hypothetical protein